MRPTSFTTIAVPMLLTALSERPNEDLGQVSKRVVREAYRASFGEGQEPAEPLMEALRQQMIREATASALRSFVTVNVAGSPLLEKLVGAAAPGRYADILAFFTYVGSVTALRYSADMLALAQELSPPPNPFEQMLQGLGITRNAVRVEFVDDADQDGEPKGKLDRVLDIIDEIFGGRK